MAGSYSAVGGYVYQDDWRAEVYVTVVDLNATTCRVTVRGEWDSIYGNSSYCTGTITKNGSGGTDSGISMTISTGGHGTFATRTFDVARGDTQRNITCKAVVVGGGSTYSGVSSTASVSVPIPAIAYTAPEPPTDCAAAYVSDTSATVSWTNGATSTVKPRSNVLVERMVDDGAWTQIASAAGTATSYTDNSISANHRYAYRVRSYGKGGYSSYSTADGYVYTTPAAPSSVVLSKTAQTVIQVDVEGSAPYATGYAVELTYDGGSTWQSVESSTSLPITVTVSGGTVQFRVASLNGSLQSAWTLSESIVTICPPLAPTITSKPSNPTAMGSSCTVEWLPNHPDGTSQTAAQVKITRPSSTSTTVDLTTETAYTFTPELAGTYSIQVRTKGLDADWGAWSDSVSWGVYEPPAVIVTSPATDGAEVVALPLNVSWSVTDATGVSTQSVIIADSSGEVFNRQVDGATFSLSLTDADVALQNETSYTITVRSMGGSGLITTVQRTFAVSWLPPVAPTLELSEGEGASTLISIALQTFDAAGEVLELPRSGIMTSLHIDGKSVQDGTPTPSNPVPIESVEPTSGTSIYIASHRKNLISNGSDSYSLIGTQYARYNGIRAPDSAESLTFSVAAEAPASQTLRLYGIRGTTGNNDDYGALTQQADGRYAVSITSAWRVARARTVAGWRIYSQPYSGGSSVVTTIYDAQLELGSTATEYEPYQGTSTPIDLQGNALRSLPDGTRDSLDVVDGVKTLTKRVNALQITSVSNVDTASAVPGARVYLADTGVNTYAPVCTHYKGYTTGLEGECIVTSNGGVAIFYNSAFTSLEAANAWFEANPTTLLYELATPQTIDLGTVDLPYCTDTAYVDAMVTPTISASFRAADSADTPETESVTVQRVNPDGSTWTVASNLPLGGTCIDPLPPLGVEATYLATASAQSGATASEMYGITVGGCRWVLNFDRAAQVSMMVGRKPTESRNVKHGGSLHHLADGGDGLPVLYETDDLDISGGFEFDSEDREEHEAIMALLVKYGRAWIRSPFGNRRLCFISANDTRSRRDKHFSVSWDAVRFEEAW